MPSLAAGNGYSDLVKQFVLIPIIQNLDLIRRNSNSCLGRSDSYAQAQMNICIADMQPYCHYAVIFARLLVSKFDRANAEY